MGIKKIFQLLPSSLFPPAFFLFCTIFLTVAIFWNVIFGTQQFAFRDGAHFYYPLYHFVQEEWAAGRVPLWIPYENLGQPLLANPVSGVFYPPKILFVLPFEFATLYHFFVVLHVVLASVTMYRLARIFDLSTSASTLAAISYAFGGSVLYQHLNVIFLIGAAWFPELLRSAFLARRSKKFSFGISWCLAMMIFGGDIQAAYHGAIAVVLILGFRRSLTPLILTFALTAVQTLPAWELAKHSNRAEGSSAASIYTAWKMPDPDMTPQQRKQYREHLADGLLCRNLSDRRHARAIYNFSVPPWKVLEWIWPNFYGSPYPQNTRWTSATPWDRFVWIPSLYCGVIPLLLSLDAIIFSFFSKKDHSKKRKAIFYWAVVFSVLLFGSFGIFAPAWGVNVFIYGAKNIADIPSGVGHPVGGVYWLMNLLLPGYAQFRYPAKLLTLAALPLSMLAAYGFDHVFSEKADEKCRSGSFSGIRFIIISVSILSLLFLGMIYATTLWDDFTQNIPRCVMFGPFQKSLAKTQLTVSLFHAFVVLTTFVFLMLWCQKNERYPRNVVMVAVPCAVVMLLGVDLFFANRKMVPTIHREYFRYESPLLEKILCENKTAEQGSAVPPRIYRYAIWYPPFFAKTSSPKRLEESVLFDRLSLWPKYTLENRITIVNVNGTMMIRSYGDHLRQVRASASGVEERLAHLGCRYVILPNRKTLDRRKAKKIYYDTEFDTALWEIKNSEPLLRLDTVKGTARVLIYEQDRIVIETNVTETEKIPDSSSRPQTLVLAEQYWPGWKAFLVRKEIETEIEIFPVQNIFRGVNVPDGENTIVFRYQPALWIYGVILSSGAWLIFGIMFYRSQLENRFV